MEMNVGKLFMIGIEGTELNRVNQTVLQRIKPGFIILFSRNYVNPEQLKSFIQDIADLLGYQPVIAIDQEGGNVLRLREYFSLLPSPMACAATNDEILVRQAVETFATEMRAVGIDWNLAPVVDVNTNPFNPVIGLRAFSDEPRKVCVFAKAFVDGLENAGVLSCLKHFPGIGHVRIDPHYDLPVSEISEIELWDTHLLPFRTVKSPAWMPTHVYLKGVQSFEEPVSLSHEMLTHLVREQMGYNGLLVADDLLMGGVSKYSLVDRLKHSFEAGMDVLTICHNPQEQLLAYEEFENWVLNQIDLRKRLQASMERIDNFLRMADAERKRSNYSLKTVYDINRKQVIEEIARRSTVFLGEQPPSTFVDGLDYVLTMKPPANSPVIDNESGKVPILAEIISKTTGAQTLYIASEKSLKILPELRGKKLIFISFNAYMYDWTSKLLKELDATNNLLLVAMQNPYDATLARNSLITFGALKSQQEAAFDVLVGKLEPQGVLPVSLRREWDDCRGFKMESSFES